MNQQTKTILIVGAGALAVYLLTRPKPASYYQQYPAYGGQPVYGSAGAYPYYNPGSTTPGLITSVAGAINTLIPNLTKLFSGGDSGGSTTTAPAALPPGYYTI